MVNPTSRRAVLAGIGTAAAATALAGCSPGSGTSTTGSGPNAPAGNGANNGPAAGSSSLGSTSDVPVGGGKIFPDQRVVVTQPSQGQLKCFTAVCTHMGCIVHDVSGGTINCACHGSKYSITDGAVVQGPAQSPLAPEQIAVSGGNITLKS